MTVFGWDASNHDWQRGPMDLAAAVRDGIQFFTHKATEGTGYRDPYLGEAIKRAKAAGMPAYGAYMVPRSGNSARAQVDFFLAYLDQQVPGWRTDPHFRILQMDTEKWPNDNVAPSLGAQACALLRPLGKYVAHYAPAWAYSNSIPGPDPLWASSYGTNPAVPYRQGYPGDNSIAWTPYSGRTPAILQYGSRTTIGRQSTCDANAIKDPQVWAAITGGAIDVASRLVSTREGLGMYDKISKDNPRTGGSSPAVGGPGNWGILRIASFWGDSRVAIDIRGGGLAEPKHVEVTVKDGPNFYQEALPDGAVFSARFISGRDDGMTFAAVETLRNVS